MTTGPETNGRLARAATLLAANNMLCAGVGFAQGLVVLRLLGAENFGAAAVLTALTAVAANVIDVRLHDLMSRLYFDERANCPHSGTAFRTAALRLVVSLSAASAVLIVALAIGLTLLLAPRLSQVPLSASWLWAAAAAQGISYFGAFFAFVQRFVVSPRRMAALQLSGSVINATAMTAAVFAGPTVGGYAFGLLASAAALTTLHACYAVAGLRQAGIRLFGPRGPRVDLDRRLILRFVAAGNVLGYVKLLHRAADVLVVAAFCGDRATGIYKLARSLTDALHAVSEPLARVYQPHLLTLLQTGNRLAYRSLARSISLTWGALTAVGIVAELLLLPFVAPLVDADPMMLTTTVVVLTVPFFFIAGLQSWIWPAYVFAGRLGRCTLWGVVAVLAGQYTIGPLLALAAGDGQPVWFAVGFCSYYVLSVLPLWHELRRDGVTAHWTAQEAPAA